MAVGIIIKPESSNIYDRAETVRKPGGWLLMDGEEIAQTMCCVHCNNHFLLIRGSGTLRSFCTTCTGVTCGRRACVEKCVPFEKKLEMIERRATQALRGL
jgi:hypothetical protein